MRIDQHNALAADRFQHQGSARTAAEGNASPETAPGAVRVSVSAAARELASASAPAGVDEAKVARLRSALDSGTLEVDSAKIAARIADGD